MTTYPGKDVTIEVSAAAGSGYAVVGELDSSSVDLSVDLEDVTSFGDEARKQLALLFDGGVELGGRYDAADAGIVILASAFFGRSSVWVQATWSGAVGTNIECLVSSFKRSAAPNGTVKVTFSLKAVAESDTTLH